jgi:hypothetical protein
MQDQTGLYVFGHVTGSTWELAKLNPADLSVQSVESFQATFPTGNGNPGYGFMVNGTLFVGDSYNSNHISESFNFATNQLTAVNITLNTGSSHYFFNTAYDAQHDTLYLADSGTAYDVHNVQAHLFA